VNSYNKFQKASSKYQINSNFLKLQIPNLPLYLGAGAIEPEV